MGKSMDERLRWLIEYLKETGREEQAALLRECFGMFLTEVERKIRKSQKGKGK